MSNYFHINFLGECGNSSPNSSSCEENPAAQLTGCVCERDKRFSQYRLCHEGMHCIAAFTSFLFILFFLRSLQSKKL